MFLTAETRTQSGFTLVELLLVVSIIAILSGFLIPGFSNYIDSQNVLQANEVLKSDLRSAQNRALTGVDASSGTTNYWGIKISMQNAPYYYTFKSAANSAAECNSVNLASAIKSETLPGGVVVRDGSGACVFFSMKNGDATFQNNGGSTTLKVGYSGQSYCDGVDVNSVGMIRTVDLCP